MWQVQIQKCESSLGRFDTFFFLGSEQRTAARPGSESDAAGSGRALHPHKATNRQGQAGAGHCGNMQREILCQ